jgi:hypothetical protein
MGSNRVQASNCLTYLSRLLTQQSGGNLLAKLPSALLRAHRANCAPRLSCGRRSCEKPRHCFVSVKIGNWTGALLGTLVLASSRQPSATITYPAADLRLSGEGYWRFLLLLVLAATAMWWFGVFCWQVPSAGARHCTRRAKHRAWCGPEAAMQTAVQALGIMEQAHQAGSCR